MDTITRLNQEVNNLVYGPSKSKEGNTIYEIAEYVGKSSSYISRCASLYEDVPMPLEIALKTMKLKKRYELIQYMATELDGVFMSIPKFKLDKKDEETIGAEYQKVAAEAAFDFINFLHKPNKETFAACEESLTKIIEFSLKAKLFTKKKASGQQELF